MPGFNWTNILQTVHQFKYKQIQSISCNKQRIHKRTKNLSRAFLETLHETVTQTPGSHLLTPPQVSAQTELDFPRNHHSKMFNEILLLLDVFKSLDLICGLQAKRKSDGFESGSILYWCIMQINSWYGRRKHYKVFYHWMPDLKKVSLYWKVTEFFQSLCDVWYLME